MIQFYINSRPVPRAIARHHLQQATQLDPKALEKWIKRAITDDPQAIRFLSEYGVQLLRVNP
jgi:hypothetical protein